MILIEDKVFDMLEIREKFYLNNVKIQNDLVIFSDGNVIKNIQVNGSIIIYSSNNYIKNVRVEGKKGITIGPLANNNKITNAYIINLEYGISIYGNYNIIKGCYFANNKYAINIFDNHNIIIESQFIRNKNDIVNKGSNRLIFNIFNDFENHYVDSNVSFIDLEK